MVEYNTTPNLTFKPAVGSLMASVSPNIRFILESSDYELAKLFELDLPGIIALKYQKLIHLTLRLEGLKALL